MQGDAKSLFSLITQTQDKKAYQDLNWEGSLIDYFVLVKKNPLVARTAFQRVYDMVLSYGVEEYTEYKKNVLRYKFFDDPSGQGRDAVFGLDIPLMKMISFFQICCPEIWNRETFASIAWPCREFQIHHRQASKKGARKLCTHRGRCSLFFYLVSKRGRIAKRFISNR